MHSLCQIQRTWRQTIRQYALHPLMGDDGAPYAPIRGKTMAFMEALWRQWENKDTLDIGQLLGQGKDVRVFGDPHFEHANIIGLCSRPFGDVDAMDRRLWMALEESHREADMVLCLGDWALKNPIFWQRKTFRAYPGKTASVIGNHDVKNSLPVHWFEAGARASTAFSVERDWVRDWVGQFQAHAVDGIDWSAVPGVLYVGVSHWPIAPRYYPGPDWVNLHGHTHNKPSKPLRMNASVEAIDFVPRRIQEMFTAKLMHEVVLRQRGLDGIDDASTPSPH